jgi:preprotein translocase subunit SecA
VLNRQRLVIYAERRRVLEGEDLHEQVRHFVDDVVEGYVTAPRARASPRTGTSTSSGPRSRRSTRSR